MKPYTEEQKKEVLGIIKKAIDWNSESEYMKDDIEEAVENIFKLFESWNLIQKNKRRS